MAPYLEPVEKPRGLVMKIAYAGARRMMGTVPTPYSVFCARMPLGFLSFYAKIARLDKKLKLPERTSQLVREQVATANSCLFCMDISRWFVMRRSPENLARIDALPEYRTSPLFTEAERAALDYAKELTTTHEVSPETFERLRSQYSEREICDIVYLVASEHVFNITNHGLGIGSDGLCELSGQRAKKGVTTASAT
jgi:alkylhydroperoxidase family enzyme